MENSALLEKLTRLIEQLQADVLRLEVDSAELLREVSASYQCSARNLIHYVALRRHDIRDLQAELASLGLSSLGRSEACVYSSLEVVRRVLLTLQGLPPAPAVDPAIGVGDYHDLTQSKRLLNQHTELLFGPQVGPRRVRIMVTMPREAAQDPQLVADLLAGGMDCLRINCAHDDPSIWSQILQNLRSAEQALGRRCRVLMDIGGPKLRTGALEPGPQVLKCRPQRDPLGRVTKPVRVWLTAAPQTEMAATAPATRLPLPAAWLSQLQVGDTIRFRDTRGASRRLQVVAEAPQGWWAELQRTAYMATGTELCLERLETSAAVGPLSPITVPLVLAPGDTLCLTRSPALGRPAVRDDAGQIVEHARISCTLPEVFADLRLGERIWFDDGKIGGQIEEVTHEEIRVKITRARAGGEKLLGDKGINLPDSKLRLSALTSQDLQDLEFVAAHADMVGMSFVHTASDVEELQRQLDRLGAGQLGLVLKIETHRAFSHLPELLLVALRSPCVGVMIARGDLAVECGYERLAELQEEILWICEAAHVPVIWATQVLEQLAKEGTPSRAEITDAAMSSRAECVMLNKGPHIRQAVAALDDILRRMEAHQTKKRALLRQLNLAHQFALAEDES